MQFVMYGDSPMYNAATSKLFTIRTVAFHFFSDKYTARIPLAEYSMMAESFNGGSGTFIQYFNGKYSSKIPMVRFQYSLKSRSCRSVNIRVARKRPSE